MLYPMPRRRHHAVALLPGESLLVDSALAAAFDHVEDPAARPALTGRALPRTQPLRLAADGAKRERSRTRIDIAKDHGSPGRRGGRHRRERFTRGSPRPAHLRIARVFIARGARHHARGGELILRRVD